MFQCCEAVIVVISNYPSRTTASPKPEQKKRNTAIFSANDLHLVKWRNTKHDLVLLCHQHLLYELILHFIGAKLLYKLIRSSLSYGCSLSFYYDLKRCDLVSSTQYVMENKQIFLVFAKSLNFTFYFLNQNLSCQTFFI